MFTKYMEFSKVKSQKEMVIKMTIEQLLDTIDLTREQAVSALWFRDLRDMIRNSFEAIENEYAAKFGGTPGKFEVKHWNHHQGGGGEISVIKGQVFEKMGVNICAIDGAFDNEMIRKEIPGTEESANFFATGISLVCHTKNPHVPAVHMNTRYVCTNSKSWIGGGADLTPYVNNEDDKKFFHDSFKLCCDRHDPNYYDKFKQWCDEYFFLAHRNEARGIGGIFYDYLNTDNFDADFMFNKEVGETFLNTYANIARRHIFEPYNEEEKYKQLVKRGRYVEFNLLYDRGTKFGLLTGGNTEGILMSMPPEVVWE